MTEPARPPTPAPEAAPDAGTELRSEILVPPGEKPLGEAIRQVLEAPPRDRAGLFERLARDIEALVAATAPDHPWTCVVYTGTDGSRVFRGGVGHSLVIDPEGRLWRARSYEDFLTTYAITPTTCTIESLTPLYEQMTQYLPR